MMVTVLPCCADGPHPLTMSRYRRPCAPDVGVPEAAGGPAGGVRLTLAAAVAVAAQLVESVVAPPTMCEKTSTTTTANTTPRPVSATPLLSPARTRECGAEGGDGSSLMEAPDHRWGGIRISRHSEPGATEAASEAPSGGVPHWGLGPRHRMPLRAPSAPLRR